MNYVAVFRQREQMLRALKKDRDKLHKIKLYYKDNPAQFICDWGMTHDPRQLSSGLIADMPFILWPRQIELINWMHERYQSKERGWIEKSRDFGATWLAVGYAATMWCFNDGFSAGFGSRKEQLVDRLGDMDSIFEKIRFFVRYIPSIFLPVGFESSRDATYMRLLSPQTGSSITGEAGDNIGRGGRKSLYIVDEKAFIDRQESVDAALSATTDCQIDISTFNGTGNLYYQQIEQFKNTKRHFVCDWRDDPRKDEAWYAKKCEELPEAIVAQEIDRDPAAANTDSFIPAKYVKAAIDAHNKLGFDSSGIRVTGFDPADTGDSKATVSRYGSIVTQCEEMKEGDITNAIPWAYAVADDQRSDVLIYDADGMGAPAMKVDLVNRAAGRLKVKQYRGSSEVDGKNKPSIPKDINSKRNGDIYQNYRSQTWTWLYDRFKATYEAIKAREEGKVVSAKADDLISISTDCENWRELVSELSAPRRIYTKNGKLLVESKKEMKARQIKSPNLADALVMAFSERFKVKQSSIQYIIHRPRDRAVGY